MVSQHEYYVAGLVFEFTAPELAVRFAADRATKTRLKKGDRELSPEKSNLLCNLDTEAFIKCQNSTKYWLKFAKLAFISGLRKIFPAFPAEYEFFRAAGCYVEYTNQRRKVRF